MKITKLKFDDIDESSQVRRLSIPHSIIPRIDLNNQFHSHLYDPEYSILEINNCFVTKDFFVFFINDKSETQFIYDIGYREKLHSNISLLRRSDSIQDANIHDNVAILLGGANNYYHWILNWMSRYFSVEYFSELSGIDIVVHNNPSSYTLQLLRKFTSIDVKQLLSLNSDITFFRKLFIPTALINPLHAPFVVRKYKERTGIPLPKEDHKLYLSRQDAKFRRILNEDDIQPILDNFGYKTIVPGSMSVNDQIEQFRKATHILSPHGAGLTNMIFCRPNFNCCEIFNEYYSKVYWSLGVVSGGKKYERIDTKNVVYGNDTDELTRVKNADIIIDPGAVESILKRMD